MAGQLMVNQVISTVETQVYSPQDYHQTEVKVQALAAEHQLSRFQLARLFKKHSGKDLTGFIQCMKLEAAANIVSYTHTPLLELALNLGYTSQQAFTRAFSQYWGISPGKMRSQRQDYVRYLHDAQGQLRVNCQIRRNRTGLKLWGIRYKGNQDDVLLHWQRFAQSLAQLLPDYQGPCYGLFYDDPATTPAGEVRYGCAIAMPAYAGLPPEGWYNTDIPPGRFVVFQLDENSYQHNHHLLCPAVMHWFINHTEQFGTAGSYEIFPHLPSTDPAEHYPLQLFISLTG